MSWKDELIGWRKSLGLSQKETSNVFDVSTSCIRKWEYDIQEPRPLALAELRRRMEQFKREREAKSASFVQAPK